MAKQQRRSKKLVEADRFRAQVVSLLGEPRTDWSDWEHEWLRNEARRPENYVYTDRERVILNRLIARAKVFSHYSEHSVQELAKIAFQYRCDLDENSQTFVEELHASRVTTLRVRQINRLASIVRLSYALPYDQDVADVMRLIWAEEERELPPYVPYEKEVA